ncbi:eosinophil peroxidase [Rhodopirellula baltica SH28]|uniref:Eosinophil peroxidase n=1 Tax=Rhodopirellula baltica SH28 TaxID=993517 RepID=K5DPM2_RHOBT|nr:peroxidase family protein [Rhodopirellula baltica]EKK04443.1 eosinophil peroxidase [Rhodopirellula baltica SH28]
MLFWSKRTRKHPGCKRRRLRSEQLESRQLLAADFGGYRHNIYDAEDVNDDGRVSAIDALLVINAMTSETSRDENVFTDVNGDGRRSALDALRVINRIERGDVFPIDTSGDEELNTLLPEMPSEARSIDGTGNNPNDHLWGSVGQRLIRMAPAAYGDGISTLAGANRPSAREVSNVLSAMNTSQVLNDRALSAFVYVWGQFIDHDLGLTESDEHGEAIDISVPEGDLWFDPTGSGEAVIPMTRTPIADGTGTSVGNPAQQFNQITAFIDGSMVYGSDAATAERLRTFVGGRMAISDNGLLPMDDSGMVIAGDVRASENIGLTAIQTLFVREHDRLADEISAGDPEATDEEIYQRARLVVASLIQSITYNEFLPALLGQHALDAYDGYDASVNPGIANEFSTAAFRLGHSTLRDDVGFMSNDGRESKDEMELKDAFFHASMLEETGIDSLLKFDASVQAQEIDLAVVDSLRNFLFGPPGAGGLDLVAMNIQRGRDHGLSDYNTTRQAYGLDRVETFDQITSDVELQQKLASLYGTVDNIDLWVGLMAEDHQHNASVGELTGLIIADQFQRTRDGDRFFYKNVLTDSEVESIERSTLADLIERNTSVDGLQENVFFMQVELRGRVILASSIPPNTMPSDLREEEIRGVSGMAIELIDASGKLVDSTVSDQHGNYRFRSLSETGDYQVRLSESGEAMDVLVAHGAERIRGLDFIVLA